MKINLKGLVCASNDTLESISNVNGSINFESNSKELSPLQTEYRRFFEGQLAEMGFKKSPFEGTIDETAEFFNNVSTRWKKRRAEFEEAQGDQD
jgi:hypothetical protein